MNKDYAFKMVEKMLYEYKTYEIAIRNLRTNIDMLHVPNCISNYSSDPVSYTVGNTGDSTANHGMKRAHSAELEQYKYRLLEKERLKRQIDEAVTLFDADELIIWTQRYIKGQSVVAIQMHHCYSKSTYFRIRKNLVLKVMRCLGEL